MVKQFFFILIFLLSLSNKMTAQDNDLGDKKDKPKLELGYLHLYNNLNADNYFEFKYPGATDNENVNLGGLNLKLTIPTKLQYLDVIVGTILMKGLDEIDFGYIDPQNVNACDYIINGGGIYFGIGPKLKGKVIGLTSDFAIGVLSFKEYMSIVNNTTEPFMDEHQLKASYGLGAISSVGVYINLGKIGINPSLTGIFSGGDKSGFVFYGFNFPVTWHF